MNTYTSRKFVLACAALVSSTVLCWYGRIADGVYSAVVIAVCAGYLTANVAQKVKANVPQ